MTLQNDDLASDLAAKDVTWNSPWAAKDGEREGQYEHLRLRLSDAEPEDWPWKDLAATGPSLIDQQEV